ncbi:autotransporter outer membrane beta-barrel domain-containing protein [Yersinia mollaretii]|uniref:autotransporter outer membrane beta-barrel domain-containing protein n=1 Tax=Yersinia mollaretii TaxID=33060 RepID=UPI0005E70005|nr:autotransporter outer membrane beta-barrel domain-containing protein [Yersinia mollaretii]MDA5526797.1 autotransporter outer membrane beta-barrel domain-containing protein [Yersinia mollaretii]MDR7872191.1 autotransporter outer membrane beta-barrel domain-containing protein [Yersinia mollaretii]PHZ30116.1 autotransporter outer membrane beta-barrel domain-containing protein [Yersinia mollaretii]WQC73285.1 autotransporter outer membrane beta-barrel domain-containing protein [Yersinia mollareti
MNQVFKVIWNSALGRYDVASEFSKSGKKTKSFCSGTVGLTSSVAAPLRLSQIAMTLILTLGAGSAFAADITVPVFTPDINFEQTFTGTGNTLVGSFSNIAKGDIGFKNSKLGDIPASNFLYGAENLISKNIFNLGEMVTETFLDPKGTGALITINVYSSTAMSIKPLADFVVPVSYAVGENGQYVNRNLFHVLDGSDLNVAVGSTAAGWVNDSDNYFNAILKGSLKSEAATTTSSGFYVESTTSAQNTVLNYNAKTVVNLGNNNNNIRDSSTAVANSVLDDFVGTFTSPYLGAQNIQNFADFQKYNNDLIAGIKSGAIVLDSKGYQAELARAYFTTGANTSPKVTPIYLDMGIDANDAVNHIVDSDRVAFIHGDGQHAIVNIGTDANIQAFNTDISLVRLEDGATLNNAGTLGSTSATVRGTNIIFATDSTVIIETTGVLDAGTNPEMLDFKPTPTSTLPLYIANGSHTAILANGASSVTNNGVINTASRGASAYTRAAVIDGNSTFVNNGAINIASTIDLSPAAGYLNEGVSVQKGSTFENNGTVYVGRQSQRSLTDVVTDLAIKTQSYAVRLLQDTVNLSNIATFTNSATGKIVIGSKTENSIAIDARGVRTAVNQNGTIELNGTGAVLGQNAAQNIGISSSAGATDIFNNGDIIINGINTVGMKVLTNSSATNTGNVYVNSGLDPVTNLANYGIQAVGVGAVANLSGAVKLAGDGAIGVVAEGQGTINVSGTGQVEFVSGKKQVGYLIYGTGSSINNIATGDETVSTEGSTLYRVDKGASFTGTSASTMNATGKDSSLIQVTGVGSTFNSGALDMVLSGEGSTGVKVEGGATGTITANASLELSGDGATAGIVDGNYYGLDGIATGATGTSVLTSSAVLSTGNTASGAYGYIARNGGELVHKGTIDFIQAGSTGVLVDGGILTNENLITVNGTAVNIQGADSTVNNSGTVNATDGTAAYLLGAGASLTLSGSGETKAGGTAHGVLLDTDAMALTVDGATITMTPGGSGNAIENKAEIEGIQLKDTTLTVGNGAGVRTGASMAATNSGVINVNGSGTGILFANTGDTITNNTLDMSDSAGLVINVNSADGKGIVTHSSQNLKTGASVNVKNAAGGAALIVNGTTAQVEQSGNLISESLSNPVVDIDNGFVNSFVNSGTIQANSALQQAVITTSGNGVAFTNATDGKIVGKVDLLAGNNTVTLMQGSEGTDFTTGSGDDLFILQDLTLADTGVFSSLNGGTGTDTLRFDHSVYTLSDADAIQNMDYIDLINNSTFTLENILLALGDSQDDNADTGFNLGDGSLLQLNNQNAVSFNNKLNGLGTMAVNTAGNAFDFTANAAQNAFNGVLALGHSTFELALENTTALVDATLKLGADSITTVGDGVQTIGGLIFDGGTAKFNTGTPGETVAKSTIHTTTEMNLLGTGTVVVDIDSVDNSQTPVNPVLPIMEQDDANTLLQLAVSDATVVGNGGNLVLKDQNGNVITDATTADIAQNGTTVAKGTYDYRLSSGTGNDGLYVGYGLTEVELLGSGTDALSLYATNKTGAAADLSAKITGSGDLAIDTGAGSTVSLSNLNNDYTGMTDVRNGSLQMLNDNVLGNTSLLSLAANTTFNMNGHSQTVGELNSTAGSSVNLNGGSLTLSQGGLSEGELTGSGELTIAADTLTVNGANNTLTATTTIASGAQALLNNAVGLGSGNIVNAGLLTLKSAAGQLANAISDAGSVVLEDNSDITLSGNNSLFSGLFDITGGSQLTASQAEHLGTAAVTNDGSLVLNSTSDWLLANSITGSGTLTKNGSGTVSLTQTAAYTGQTDINAGGLILGSSADPMTLASQQVNIADGAFMGGFGGVAGAIDNKGVLFVGNPTASTSSVSSRLAPASNIFTVGTDLTNSGTVFIGNKTSDGSGTTGNQLVVNGNYVGDNGLLHFNTALGDDNSATDSMIVNGNTSGTTNVSVDNAGGLGAKTLNGIELIQVNGQSDGDFVQSGRIVAGAYDYSLKRGAGQNAANWYLTSLSNLPIDPDNPVDPENPVAPGEETKRPEAGSYTANLASANNMFVTRLHDRLGETQYIDVLTGEKKVTSMWLRNEGGHNRSRDTSGQLKTQSNRYVMQLGGDIAQWSNNGLDRLHLGVMAGYGNSKSDTNAKSGYKSKGSVDGYSTGVYSTWYANDEDKSGLYVDGWAQYSWFNNTVQGEGLATEEYKSKGITASVESGYTFKIGENKSKNETYFIQPKAQITWMGVKADDHTEANGTRVSGQGDGNIQTRLGLRSYMKGHHESDNGKDREFQPFVEANWIHNTKDFGTNMNAVEVKQAGAKNIGELKMGVEGQLNKQLNVWGNVGQQLGDKGYSDTAVMLGVKYNF